MNVETKELIELAPADVFGEHKCIACAGAIARRARSIGKEGQLRPGAARHCHAMYLRNISEACGDQDLALHRMPVEQRRRTDIVVPFQLLHHSRRNLWYPLSVQIQGELSGE